MASTKYILILCFLHIQCSLKKQKSQQGMLYGPSTAAIPSKPIKPWRGEVCAAYTGPNAGLTRFELDAKDTPMRTTEKVAGCHYWNVPREYAYGISLSLYEEDRQKSRAAARSERNDSRPSSCTCIVGDPVADVFGILVRENWCVMAVADGVNWGKKSRLAARCATYAVMDHISNNSGRIESNPSTSTVLQLLHESVTLKAQELILKKGGTLTTLSAAVVCDMGAHGEWGLFICAVGDSPVYVYCPHTKQVIEATVGCHTLDGVRDMRMAGGVLGPSFGSSPDLTNLTYAYLPVYPGDIVFAVSDGVSDNFSDKVMGSKETEKKSTLKSCCDNIPHLTKVLNEHQEKLRSKLSAQTVTACLINHSVEVTEDKRVLRTQCLEENIDIRRESRQNPDFAAKFNAARGKLDHATVVAYQVGHHFPC